MYKRQTLGSVDPLPKGFKIHENPQVEAYVDGEKREIRVEESDLGDGRLLKIYNSRIVGGKVTIKVVWKIDHILELYSDIAELNWFPISDGDEDLSLIHIFLTWALVLVFQKQRTKQNFVSLWNWLLNMIAVFWLSKVS